MFKIIIFFYHVDIPVPHFSFPLPFLSASEPSERQLKTREHVMPQPAEESPQRVTHASFQDLAEE